MFKYDIKFARSSIKFCSSWLSCFAWQTDSISVSYKYMLTSQVSILDVRSLRYVEQVGDIGLILVEPHLWLGLYTVSKVWDSIGIIKSILVSVSERQLNNTFHNDINKHKAILTQKWLLMFYVCLITSFNLN